MLTTHNARIVTAYAALFTFAAGFIVNDAVTRADAALPDLALSSQAKAISAEKAARSERAAKLRRMNQPPTAPERIVAKK